MFKFSKKIRIVLATYILALVLTLSLFSFVCAKNLKSYRTATGFSSQQAFEETVAAVGRMSETLKKAAYATDRDMCERLCTQVYADALSAEAALSTLPFATHELERISGYLNQTGDYAYTLCCSVSDSGFDENESLNLRRLSELSAGLNDSLVTLRQDFHNGSIEMDSSELFLRNVDVTEREKISTSLLRFESDFPEGEALRYDGKYSFQAKEKSAPVVSDAQLLAAAARFAGVSPGQLTLERSFEDGSGRKVYSVGNVQVCVGAEGVLNMAQSRLIDEPQLTPEKAEKIASDFLEELGYRDLLLSEKGSSGNAASFKFIALQDGAHCPDNYIRLSVVLDDGSIYTFDADHYSPEKSEVAWQVSEIEAAGAIPDVLEEQQCDRTIIETEGGRALACYDFICKNEAGEGVTIRVNAATGRQFEIIL